MVTEAHARQSFDTAGYTAEGLRLFSEIGMEEEYNDDHKVVIKNTFDTVKHKAQLDVLYLSRHR